MKKYSGESQIDAKAQGYVLFCPEHEMMLKKGERCCDLESHPIGCECEICNPLEQAKKK